MRNIVTCRSTRERGQLFPSRPMRATSLTRVRLATCTSLAGSGPFGRVRRVSLSSGVPASMRIGSRSRLRGFAASAQTRDSGGASWAHSSLSIAAGSLRRSPASVAEATRSPDTPLRTWTVTLA